ncbi:hypothetical protein EST38_g6538 [Candolleomyces aberdarensis]|uniref:Uncharacterized protein n=1 Tax=Candolleomyces aberdarensis TaxID=2316362 RepID=A0A4Q2DJL6_9AGAR|nr:hypothetical protein EST38_g6538 [Candolleomyces aberdarensis]
MPLVLTDLPTPRSVFEARMRVISPRVPVDLYTMWCEDKVKAMQGSDASPVEGLGPQQNVNQVLALLWSIEPFAAPEFKAKLKEYYERGFKATWNWFVHWALMNARSAESELGKIVEEFLLPDDFEVYYKRYIEPLPSNSTGCEASETAGKLFFEATFVLPPGLAHGILNLDDLWAQTPDYEKMVFELRGRIYQDVLKMEKVLECRATAKTQSVEILQDFKGLRIDELLSYLPTTAYARYAPRFSTQRILEEEKRLLESLESCIFAYPCVELDSELAELHL